MIKRSADLGDLVGLQGHAAEGVTQTLRGEQVGDVAKVSAGDGREVGVPDGPTKKSFQGAASARRARVDQKHEPAICWHRGCEVDEAGLVGDG